MLTNDNYVTVKLVPIIMVTLQSSLCSISVLNMALKMDCALVSGLLADLVFSAELAYIITSVSTSLLSFCLLTWLVLLAGKNVELLEKMEALFNIWHSQIEQVLTEHEQIRREADSIGPDVELQYWKNRMDKFHMYVPLTYKTFPTGPTDLKAVTVIASFFDIKSFIVMNLKRVN